jgi:DNA polymerase elongation subunit (family B)
VPLHPNYDQLDNTERLFWDKKANILNQDTVFDPPAFYQRAGIYSEFGKVVCISVGYFSNFSGDVPSQFKIKSFSQENEFDLLSEFAKLCNHKKLADVRLAGHNIREFDIPYLCRRMLINGIRIPALLNVQNLKPWEIQHIDTLQLWKFGDFKNYTSLDLLCAVFNIPSPKSDINGSEIGKVFWEQKDFERIAKYCEQDVLAVAKLYAKMNFIELPEDLEVSRIG